MFINSDSGINTFQNFQGPNSVSVICWRPLLGMKHNFKI